MTYHTPQRLEAQPAPAASTGRYHLDLTVGASIISERSDELSDLEQTFAAFQRQYAGNRDAGGSIFDWRTLRMLAKWSGAPKPAPVENPIIALFERAIASGQPVTLIHRGGRREFNSGARS